LTNSPHTLVCHCCEERKPRSGFHLLANRYVSVCPECWPTIEPYLEQLRDFRSRMDEQAARFVVGLIRRSNASGTAPPAPDFVAEQIDDITALIRA
jgi:hypothetical protein